MKLLSRRNFSQSMAIGLAAASGNFSVRAFGQIPPRELARAGNFDYQVNFIPWFGQSWSLGFDSQAAITTYQKYDSLAFNGGVRQLRSRGEDPSALRSFVPAVEENSTGSPEHPSATLGETGAVAMCEMIKEMIHRENGVSYKDQKYRLLVSAMGEGDKRLEDLSDNALPYMTRLKEQIYCAFEISRDRGEKFGVPAVMWIQGFSRSTGYADKLEAMRLDINEFVEKLCGQIQPVKLITWQQMVFSSLQRSPVSATEVYNRFVGASDAHPHIVVAGPSYQYRHRSSKNLHIINEDMRALGRCMGIAFKRVVVDGAEWQPLRPISLQRHGKVAVLKWNVGTRSLVADTARIQPLFNFGLNVYDAGGVFIPTVATISAPDSINFVAEKDFPPGCSVRNADVGRDLSDSSKWRSQIRDNSAEIDGENRFSVAFSFPFSN